MKHSPNKLALFVSVILFLAIAACKEPIDPPPPPVITPCFTLQNDTFMDPRLPVQFLNCSQGATSYRWHFGDGTVSTLAEPSHLYADTGRYDVLLEALNGDSSQMLNKQIRVDYPRFKKIRILQMPVMNPDTGLPWDDDGSGVDLKLTIKYDGWPGLLAYGTVWSFNVTLPYEFVLNSDVGIYQTDWEFLIRSYYPNPDTVIDFGRHFTDLMDGPSEIANFPLDSVRIEIVVEGAR